MKIIIGLGNPEEKYNGTRHNIGFYFLDKIKENFSFPDFSLEGKFKAEMTRGVIASEAKQSPEIATPPTASRNDENVILVKPQTFMNLSGEAVRAILDFYKLTPADIIVLHDDLDIKIGEYKIATDSRSAGHNGVQSIIDNLDTQNFTRIRIGIGQDQDGVLACRLDAHDFVLQKFSAEELKKIGSIEKNILEEIKKMTS